MVRKEIEKLVRKAISEAQKEKKLPKFEIGKISLERPENQKYGDYSSNIAMQTAKSQPLEIADIIKLKVERSELFEKVEIAGPGFINFFISKQYLQKQVEEILKKREKFADLDIGKGKKIQIEFISANPTGPLTVGNGRGGPFGDVLAAILEKVGFKVERAYYVNNYGKQILALGHSVLKDKEAVYKGEYIDKLYKTIKSRDPYKTGEEAAGIIIQMIKKSVDKMGIKFDEWFFENQLHQSGEIDKTIELLKKKKLVYEEEGALWFKAKKYGDIRDRVLVKKDGSKTYLAGDIAYHRYKLKKFDKVIDVWGADHYGDMAGLKAALDALGYKGRLEILLHQFVTILRKGEKIRMSKRKGVYFTMEELLDQAGSDAVRFFFLQKSINTHLNFDLDLAKEQSEKNPVYYAQYAYARINSILAKSDMGTGEQDLSLLVHPSELSLIKQLIRFPEVIEDTVNDYQVQRLAQYALDLAASFHKFYQACRVLGVPEIKARLALISGVKIVLKNTFDLMGISAPEKM